MVHYRPTADRDYTPIPSASPFRRETRRVKRQFRERIKAVRNPNTPTFQTPIETSDRTQTISPIPALSGNRIGTQPIQSMSRLHPISRILSRTKCPRGIRWGKFPPSRILACLPCFLDNRQQFVHKNSIPLNPFASLSKLPGIPLYFGVPTCRSSHVRQVRNAEKDRNLLSKMDLLEFPDPTTITWGDDFALRRGSGRK